MIDNTTVLLLPGIGDSGPEHWQSHWERQDDTCHRVIQTEWDAPVRSDWEACLDAAIIGVRQPVVLVGHSSACALVAHWAVRATPARHALIRGALLVAPSDPEGINFPKGPDGFAPVPMARLPFPTIVVGSTDDPYVSAAQASAYADAWGSRYVELSGAGHINVAAGFGPWPDGMALLTELRNAPRRDDSIPPWLESNDSLDAFLVAFRSGAFPIAWWTHGAHVAMAASVLWDSPVPRALAEIREAIRHYNVSQGGQNTDSSGYHETLTRLWVGIVASTLTTLPDGADRLSAARHAYLAFARRSGYFRDWYGYDLLKSSEARGGWVAPEGERASWFGGA
ncbi:MAG: alpha/beta hydrolase [Gemmatimonadota bacterium]